MRVGLIIYFVRFSVDNHDHDAAVVADVDFVAVGGGDARGEGASVGVDDAVIGAGNCRDIDGLVIRPYLDIGGGDNLRYRGLDVAVGIFLGGGRVNHRIYYADFDAVGQGGGGF